MAWLFLLDDDYWLVVGPPLWKIWVRQLGWLATQYANIWENKIDGNQTTNQIMIIPRLGEKPQQARRGIQGSAMTRSLSRSKAFTWSKTDAWCAPQRRSLRRGRNIAYPSEFMVILRFCMMIYGDSMMILWWFYAVFMVTHGDLA